MEQAIAFFTGVLSVLSVIGIISMIKTASQVKYLRDDIDELRDLFNELELEAGRSTDMLDRRIDGEIGRVDDIHEDILDYIETSITDMSEDCTKKFKKKN
jgi:hypothetical protein|tara:strand:+ start:4396 stop:4695 length:300 start_codon:yes stop_codon:yes gene_type:complete